MKLRYSTSNRFVLLLGAVITIAASGISPALAQTSTSGNVIQDSFTGGQAQLPWQPLGNACLTAGSSSSSGVGQIPACTTITDNAGYGALRLTDAANNEAGAVIDTTAYQPSQGLEVTFTTYTYGGNSGGNNADGADGIGFYLIDATKSQPSSTWHVGAFGGSLGYSCSNVNNNTATGTGYDGLANAYLGLGMDEFGNFLNAGDNTGTGDQGNGTNGNSTTGSIASGSGPEYQPGRIGLRGYGNITKAALTAINASATDNDVKATCANGGTYYYNPYTYYTVSSTGASYTGTLYTRSGYYYNYSYTQYNGNSANCDGTCYGKSGNNYVQLTSNTGYRNSSTLADYAAIPGAFAILPNNKPIASETASTRSQAVPITYQLKITSDGNLSLKYSYNGGNYTTVLQPTPITNSNASVPTSLYFGFGGSTGGSNNVHEITCFEVTPADQSASSAGLNVQQAGEWKTTTQVYLASYHTNGWWGELTSQNLVVNGNTLSISPNINWDASCVLTGGACSATNGTNTAQATRNLLTWNDATGAAVQMAWDNLSSTEKSALNAGDSQGQNRLAYLMGDRSNEIPVATGQATGTQIFRDRTSVLGDIIDSSPTWVGPPSAPYPAVWKDLLYPTASMSENATNAVTYPTFASNNATRLNVVYDGSNDGFMHGFEAGSYDDNGNYVNTYNDGAEVIAYMPATVMESMHNAANASTNTDFSYYSYAHNYFTDATPGTGDLFYNNSWHTWLVSGLGAGGSAIFAMDITDPTQFSSTNTSVILGEWNSTTLTCANVTNCGNNLGQTWGTPQIRRLHNGEWGIIFGNGLSSSTGHAGIYIMTISGTGTLDKVYFLDTGVSGTASNPDGIAYVTPVDLDGDHITDYVYAGDAYGNVWRFELTDSNPSNWIVSTYGQTAPTPLFTTPTTKTVTTTPSSGSPTSTVTSAPVTVASQPTTPDGSTTSGNKTTTVTNQPITTQLTVLAVSPTSTGQPRIMIEFGTGSTVPQSSSAAVQYAPGQQALYGIWDWYMGQTGKVNAQFGGLIGSPGAPTSQITLSQLQQQTVTGTYSAAQSGIGQGARTVSNNAVCFVGMTCATTSSNGTTTTAAGTMLGWYLNLPGFNGVSGVGGANQTEQVIYSPLETDGAFIVNTVVPSNSSPLTCTSTSAQGWTMALNPATGGAFLTSFFADSAGSFVNVNGQPVSGVALNGTGSPSVVTYNNQYYLVSQTVNGAGVVNEIHPPGTLYTKRLTWLQIH